MVWRVLSGLLFIALAGAVLASVVLFRQAMDYYQELNYVRLDPYGLLVAQLTAMPTNEPDSRTIVFIGDSRIFDWTLPVVENVQMINLGLGGQTSEQVLGRFRAQLPLLTPDVVVVQMGINDIKTIPLFPDERDAIVQNAQTNLNIMMELIAAAEAQLVLMTVIPTGRVPLERQVVWSDAVPPALGELNDYIRAQSGSQITLLDAHRLLADEQGYLNPAYARDFLHVNEAGYQVLSDALITVLTTSP